MKKYKGCKLITIPTVKWEKLNATLRAAVGRYDVIHYHAEDPCATLPIAKFLGIKTVATIHGILDIILTTRNKCLKYGSFSMSYV